MLPDDDENIGWCQCGGAWFHLAQYDDAEGDLDPAVCISRDGEITGYAGKLVCIDCGGDWNPNVRFKATRGHLRVVE